MLWGSIFECIYQIEEGEKVKVIFIYVISVCVLQVSTTGVIWEAECVVIEIFYTTYNGSDIIEEICSICRANTIKYVWVSLNTEVACMKRSKTNIKFERKM